MIRVRITKLIINSELPHIENQRIFSLTNMLNSLLFTIGHSNHSLEEFLNLLTQHQITALADVRSHPYSRYLPHFSQENLKKSLKEAGIAYVFLGKELGARPQNLSCYINGKAVYQLIAATEEFKTGLQRLQEGSKNYKIALMCAEQDPITCHRAILVSRYLKAQGLEVQHIHKDGQLETHDQLELRLLKLHNLDSHKQENSPNMQLSLFNLVREDQNDPLSQEELLEKAYQLQGDKIAYVDQKQPENSDQ